MTANLSDLIERAEAIPMHRPPWTGEWCGVHRAFEFKTPAGEGKQFVIKATSRNNGPAVLAIVNLFPELLALAATAGEYVRADENGEPWPAPAVSLRKRLDALTSALARELGEAR